MYHSNVPPPKYISKVIAYPTHDDVLDVDVLTRTNDTGKKKMDEASQAL